MRKVTVRDADGNLILEHTLDKLPIRIGRDPSCAIIINNPKVSRFHAQVIEKSGTLWLLDTQSANGILINGTTVDEVPLVSGLNFKISDYQLYYDEIAEKPTVPEESVVVEATVFLPEEKASHIDDEGATRVIVTAKNEPKESEGFFDAPTTIRKIEKPELPAAPPAVTSPVPSPSIETGTMKTELIADTVQENKPAEAPKSKNEKFVFPSPTEASSKIDKELTITKVEREPEPSRKFRLEAIKFKLPHLDAKSIAGVGIFALVVFSIVLFSGSPKKKVSEKVVRETRETRPEMQTISLSSHSEESQFKRVSKDELWPMIEQSYSNAKSQSGSNQ